jgi:multiple sugar transport system ATP-binding protein
VALDAASRLEEGQEAQIWLDPSRIHLFDPQSGDNLTNAGYSQHGDGDGARDRVVTQQPAQQTGTHVRRTTSNGGGSSAGSSAVTPG